MVNSAKCTKLMKLLRGYSLKTIRDTNPYLGFLHKFGIRGIFLKLGDLMWNDSFIYLFSSPDAKEKAPSQMDPLTINRTVQDVAADLLQRLILSASKSKNIPNAI